MLASMSLTPISTMSTPSTAAISSALSTASADSNCTITMVASFIAALASAVGNERYSRWGRAPPAPRSPSGGNFAALTTARASSADPMPGATMPSAPPSSTRWIYSGVLAGTRTIGAIPTLNAAWQICPVASSVMVECSRSI